ncbi:MAG: hypothetical protein HZC15_00645 [Candidatus Omnitrophica bacterium]|jgi:hypothetical protein|nr:hypothetical protein [Candidatus Omnitrophota bacterium]
MIMKMVLIVYNEALDFEAMELLGQCGLKYYTKLNGVFGSGQSSGIHFGNDIWPGRNNILYVACSEDQSKQITSGVVELRKKLGKEGIKAFVLPLEEMS